MASDVTSYVVTYIT